MELRTSREHTRYLLYHCSTCFFFNCLTYHLPLLLTHLLFHISTFLFHHHRASITKFYNHFKSWLIFILFSWFCFFRIVTNLFLNGSAHFFINCFTNLLRYIFTNILTKINTSKENEICVNVRLASACKLVLLSCRCTVAHSSFHLSCSCPPTCLPSSEHTHTSLRSVEKGEDLCLIPQH